jgi:hypothetical protein
MKGSLERHLRGRLRPITFLHALPTPRPLLEDDYLFLSTVHSAKGAGVRGGLPD